MERVQVLPARESRWHSYACARYARERQSQPENASQKVAGYLLSEADVSRSCQGYIGPLQRSDEGLWPWRRDAKEGKLIFPASSKSGRDGTLQLHPQQYA